MLLSPQLFPKKIMSNKNTMKYVKPFIIAVIAMTVVLLGSIVLYQYTRTQKPKPAPLTTVTLAMDWTPNTDHTGLYVALAKGWYKKQGIDLKILPFASNLSATQLVLNKKADVGIGSMEDIVGSSAKGNPVVAIAPVLQHNTSGFIVLADSNINRPKELDGKIYGGWGSPFENAVVTEIIKKDGGKGNFKNVVLSTDAMQALETKRIDFVWVLAGWEVMQAKRSGYKVNFFPLTQYGIPDSPTLAFVVTPDEIKNKPELLKKFITATAQGYEYARQHPKEAAQMLIDGTPKGTFPDTGLVFDSQNYISTQYADPGKKWGQQTAQMWHDYPQFMLNAGSITDANGKPVTTIDFGKLYTTQFIQ